MPEAERLSENEQLAEKRSFEDNFEIMPCLSRAVGFSFCRDETR